MRVHNTKVSIAKNDIGFVPDDLGEVVQLFSDPVPDPDVISYYKLEKERKIYLDYEISPDVMRLQRMLLRWNMEDKDVPVEERKPIWIYIFSYGGDMDYMWSIVDAIMMSKTPVYTVNLGVAASAASLIFVAGHKRFMAKNADVIIHEGSASMQGDAVKVFDNVANYKEAVKRMKTFILEHTKIPPSLMNKKRNNDWHIDAEFCLKNGVCDKIIEDFSAII